MGNQSRRIEVETILSNYKDYKSNTLWALGFMDGFTGTEEHSESSGSDEYLGYLRGIQARQLCDNDFVKGIKDYMAERGADTDNINIEINTIILHLQEMLDSGDLLDYGSNALKESAGYTNDYITGFNNGYTQFDNVLLDLVLQLIPDEVRDNTSAKYKEGYIDGMVKKLKFTFKDRHII